MKGRYNPFFLFLCITFVLSVNVFPNFLSHKRKSIVLDTLYYTESEYSPEKYTKITHIPPEFTLYDGGNVPSSSSPDRRMITFVTHFTLETGYENTEGHL